MGKGSEKPFLMKIYQMANKHIKRCMTSLFIREMQIIATKRYHLISIIMAIIKKSK